jgi:glutamate synthase (NADPH/NADH) small chain
MGQPETAQQPKERRVKNFSEVSFGFTKTVAQTEARRCPQCADPTCNPGCPLGIDIPAFIRALREGDATAALNKIKEKNPLPGVCGRVCLAPCETSCVFNDENAAVGIRALERFAADNGRGKFTGARIMPPSKNKTVAIVGSGPSGLVAASELAQKGYGVTIFEALPQAGGIMRYGIPEFRLPSKTLDAEITDIQVLGVTIQTNTIVGEMITFDELTARFDAVLLATGTGSPQPSLAGDHLIGVYYAQEFLMRVNLLSAANYPKTPTPALLGHKVAVIGAGYAALDCARAVLRLGKKASIVFAGLEEEIEVYPQERKDAIDEGVKLESLTRPLEIIATPENAVAGLKCERLDIAEDASGKLDLKVVPGSEFTLEADTVILAGDSQASSALKRYLPNLVWNPDGTVRVNDVTGLTSLKNIFATGNLAAGAGILVDAMANGKRAAQQIADYLL